MLSSEQHILFMRQALLQAKKAFDRDEVPVGAVIIDPQGRVIARSYNQSEKRFTQTAHAEMCALAHAGKKMGDWRLQGCWLYVTLEPCAMCMHAIILSRITGVVFGAPSPLFGYRLDKLGSSSIYKNHLMPLVTIEGVLADECKEIVRRFFKKKRKRSERSKDDEQSS